MAIKKSKLDKHAWAQLLVEIDEEPITLHNVDLIHYEEMNEQYRLNIDNEGVIIYG